MSSYPVAPADSEPLVKRRRLRKGTHSCWQCKKRKVRCIPDPLADGGACDGCRRRGSRCVGQDCPEDGSLPTATTPNPDHTSVGITVTANTNSPPTLCKEGEITGKTTPATASSCDQSSHQNCLAASVSGDHIQQVYHGKLETLSQYLHRSLPSREDTKRICLVSQHQAVLAHEIITMPYTTLCEKGLKTPETLLDIPGPDQHPVLLARHMLLLASFLQRKQVSNIVVTLLGNSTSQVLRWYRPPPRSARRDQRPLRVPTRHNETTIRSRYPPGNDK